MCLLLYIASEVDVPAVKNDDIAVEPVEENRRAIMRWFSLPNVRYIGAPGCSCTFPHVEAEQAIEWYAGMFDESEDREPVLASVRALLALLRQLLATSAEVQMLSGVGW